MSDILEEIAAYARIRVEEKKKTKPLSVLKNEIQNAAYDFPFEKALKKEDMNVIAECKKASPSKGLISPDFPYLSQAQSYEAAGAAAISVLTETKWFLGKDEYLKEIAQSVQIPVLRKDFTVDPYMIYEAKVLGASAVLLIVSLLDEKSLEEDLEIADELGLSALVEAHDEEEVKLAYSSGARIIGVNNRNLRDFTIDFNNSIRLRNLVGDDVIFVAESGIHARADVLKLSAAGIHAVLIGEQLMRAEDPGEEIGRLKGTVV